MWRLTAFRGGFERLPASRSGIQRRQDVFSPKPVRALALTGITAMTLTLVPATAAAAEPGLVRWLPKLGDTNPVRGRSVASDVRISAKRIKEEEKPGVATAFPVDGRHDYGDEIDRFGAPRTGHVHAGQDVFTTEGTPLVAVRDGVVLEAGTDSTRGNYIGLFSPEAKKTYVYMHLAAPALVEAGDKVKAGDKLGAAGCTGSCDGVHLHFEVRDGRGLDAQAVDPLPLLQRWEKLEH